MLVNVMKREKDREIGRVRELENEVFVKVYLGDRESFILQIEEMKVIKVYIKVWLKL